MTKKKKNNSMTLNEDDSNKESTANAVTIQITLPMVTYLLTIAYRITVKLLSVWPIKPPTLWPHY